MLFKLFVILAPPLPFSHIHAALTSRFSLALVDTNGLWYSCPCHLDLDLSNHTVSTILCRNPSCFGPEFERWGITRLAFYGRSLLRSPHEDIPDIG